MERAAAAKGLSSAHPQFANQDSVLHGGVLLLFPSLVQQGLYKATELYSGIKAGFYRVESIILTLAIMALCRIKNPEQTKQCKPGELGKVIGLDRIPEVKCLREKIQVLSDENKSQELSNALLRHWMPENVEEGIYLYIDGHVRIYHGSQANLTSKFISRQKLCLSATTDFWVNDETGSPLMVVSGELSEKLQQVIQDVLVPQIEQSGILPSAPPNHPIYTIVVDREAYKIPFFKWLWEEKQIAVITYRKHVKDLWNENEFTTIEIDKKKKETMRIAEKEIQLDGLALREIRVLTVSGHQTAIITTNPVINMVEVAIRMFNRWKEENFFKYMLANYDFDRIISYGVETIDENKEVVNPPHRCKKYEIKKTKEKVRRLEAQFYPLLEQAIDTSLEQMPELTRKQKEIKEKIDALHIQIKKLEIEANAIPPRIKLKDMPADFRYNKLTTESQMVMNIMKMICYRAETAVANLSAPYLTREEDEKRKFVQQIIDSPVDMVANHQEKVLNITMYSLSAPRYNKALMELIKLLNETETIFPGTDLRLFYKLHS
jgi:hypothetical protein